MTEARRYDATPDPDVVLARETYSYDERGRRWRTQALYKDPSQTYSDAVTTVERFKTGHVRYVTDPRSKVSERQYDYAWRVTKEIDPLGDEFASTWDAASRRTAWSVKEIDGGSSVTHEWEADFDDAGRMTARREVNRLNAAELETLYGHDSRGNLVWTVNAKGDPTRFTFDGVGRMVQKEVALTTGTTIEDFTSAVTTQWGFDDNNRLVSFKDDGQNETTWAHDALDRPTTMTYPDDSAIAWEHDLDDDVVETTDAAGNVIEDTFDDAGRLTDREVTLVTGFTGTTAESREYDALDRLTAAEDDDYRVEFTYGVIGMRSTVYSETQAYSGGAYSKTVTSRFDGAGNRTYLGYPGGMALTYAWNDANRLSSVTDGTNTLASFTYIGLRPKVTTFQNGATATTSYTGYRGEVERVHHQTSGSSTIVRMDYGYDANHDRTWERFGAAGSSGEAFEYDKARRLVTAWMGSSAPPTPSGNAYVKKIEYDMDDDGNRDAVATTVYGQQPASVAYTSNALNQYTDVGGATQTHDGNGNLANNGTYKFKYDYRNQLCEVRLVADDTLVATYKHDPLGRRVEKDRASGTDERYVYSGVETVQVYTLSGTLRQAFVFGEGIDEVLMLQQADVLDYDSDSNTSEGTRSFYHRNALGSVMTITDMNQAVVEDIRYDPYGAATITRGGQGQSSDPLGQHWAFTARFLDEETGLMHYRARAYDPATGRFLQRDPLGTRAGPSLYEYARSSPDTLADPTGLTDDGPMRDPQGKPQPVPGTDGSKPDPSLPPSSPEAAGFAGAQPGRHWGGYLREAKDRCGVSADFVYMSSRHRIIWIQYRRWDLLYGDPAGEAHSTWAFDDKGSGRQVYPYQGTSPINAKSAMTDTPGFRGLTTDAIRKDPSRGLDAIGAYAGVNLGGATWATLLVEFQTYAVDLTLHRVVAKWEWWWSIAIDTSVQPAFVYLSYGQKNTLGGGSTTTW